MKGKTLAIVAVSVGLLGAAVVYAGYDSGPAPGTDVVTSGNIREDTVGPREDLAVKQQDLRHEYNRANPDPDRIAVLQDQIDELRAQIRNSAYVYDTGSTRGRWMHHNRMMWRGGYYGGGCGCW
jgi:hypothetical protein